MLVVSRFADLAVPGPETCCVEWKVGRAIREAMEQRRNRIENEENMSFPR